MKNRTNAEVIYSPIMERALAGCAVMDGGVTALDVLPEHFHLQDCGTIWRMASEMYAAGEYVDFVTILDEIERRGLDISASFVAGLEAENFSTVHAPTYAQRVREDAHRRQSERYAQRLVRLARQSNGTYPADLEQLTQHITAHSERLRPAVAVADVPPATWADLPDLLGPITWDWPGWLVRGMLAELVASSGVGKSNLALRIAGTYVCGWSWPDGTPYRGEVGSVLWCEAEAAQKLNLDRAIAWGLPLERLLTPLPNPIDEVDLFSAAHRAAIAERAARTDVKLIVVDSLSGASAGRERGEDQMPIVKFFAELARNTNKPVLLLHHLRKRSLVDVGGDVVTLDQVRGATQITQMARVIWALDMPNGNDLDHKRLHIIKNNLARFAEPLGLRITDDGLIFDAAPTPPRADSPLNRAIDLLRSILEHGPVAVTKIEEEAAGAAISMSTMRDAKESLHALALRKGKGQGSYWIWSLPAVLPQAQGGVED
jgi:hypothetical protein